MICGWGALLKQLDGQIYGLGVGFNSIQFKILYYLFREISDEVPQHNNTITHMRKITI